ncbi:GspH/FimT family pseudopilin [Pseudoalteromonas mariniglutinosa]|uniref:GspH/FimT family pseudopilin n=1 Tax=Pseudoalteromonas mariniglutinosa TaxID=206042 RepID=UPI00384BB5DD
MKKYTHYCLFQQGATLIESMVVIAIISVLLHFALFEFKPLLAKNRLDNHTHLLKRTLGISRYNAMQFNSYTTVCALVNNRCQQQHWHKAISVFIDHDEIGVFDDNDRIIYEIEQVNHHDMLTYPRPSVTFRPDGTPLGFNNGTFIYCPEYKKASLTGLAISVSYTGRTRLKQTKKCQM